MSVEEWFAVFDQKYGNDFNWFVLDYDSTFVNELKHELGIKFANSSVSSIAKCESNDNVLFLFENVYRIYHLTYSNNSSNLSYIEFIDLDSAMKYIEKDYTENYL